MVYIEANQTRQYPRVKEHFKTTKEHFHDNPSLLEPSAHNTRPTKSSTLGKLYPNSLYFMKERLTTHTRKAMDSEFTLGTQPGTTSKSLSKTKGPPTQPYTWSGRLPSCYEGNGTFRLANNLTYSCKPVKLVPYSITTFKSEYQDEYLRKSMQPYGSLGFTTLRKSVKF